MQGEFQMNERRREVTKSAAAAAHRAELQMKKKMWEKEERSCSCAEAEFQMKDRKWKQEERSCSCAQGKRQILNKNS